MTRLVLAILILAVLAAGAAILVMGLAAVWRGATEGGTGDGPGGETMQKIAFALLLALIVYVSVWGPA